MNNIAELARKARELKSKGLTTGEISDELNVSRETALWFLTHRIVEGETAPLRDIYVNWRSLGASAVRLSHVSAALTDLILETLERQELENPEVIAGVANSGVPIASFVALELGAGLAVVVPKKHLWEPEKSGRESGYLLSNFADISEKKVVLIDDVITTGATIKDTLNLLRNLGSKPLMAAVLLDKAGLEAVDSVPVKALFTTALV